MPARNERRIQAELAELARSAREYVTVCADAKILDNAALRIIVHKDWKILPDEIRSSVQVIFDVHDGRDKPWHPADSEILEACLAIEDYLIPFGHRE